MKITTNFYAFQVIFHSIETPDESYAWKADNNGIMKLYCDVNGPKTWLVNQQSKKLIRWSSETLGDGAQTGSLKVYLHFFTYVCLQFLEVKFLFFHEIFFFLLKSWYHQTNTQNYTRASKTNILTLFFKFGILNQQIRKSSFMKIWAQVRNLPEKDCNNFSWILAVFGLF